MTFISCHRIWLWEVLEITVCKNNCEVCDVFLWSLRCCFFFHFVLRFFFFFELFVASSKKFYAYMHRCTLQLQHIRECNAHTNTHSKTGTLAHTHTSHTHTFILLCKFSCSCDSPALKEAARFCHTRHWWDREGRWCEKEWDHATPRDNTRVSLPPLPPFPVLFLLGTPRLEFILIFSSSWQRFYLHCFNLYLFCTLKITLRTGCGGGEGGRGEWGIGSCISSAAKQKLLCKCRVQRWRWQWKCAQVTKAKKERRSGGWGRGSGKVDSAV